MKIQKGTLVVINDPFISLHDPEAVDDSLLAIVTNIYKDEKMPGKFLLTSINGVLIGRRSEGEFTPVMQINSKGLRKNVIQALKRKPRMIIQKLLEFQ